MNLETTTPIDFMTALRQQRERNDSPIPDAPNLNEWLQYWNDEESFTANMRNLAHWIACAKAQAA
ncbi:MAG: hypothetical protein AB7F79_04585 [Steroidobacteraceae bacterium]